MGNASLGKFAICRKEQADKDSVDFSNMLFHPHIYGGGFNINTEVDNFNDIVESKFETSKTQILSALTSGGITVPATADILALSLASMLNNVVSAQVSAQGTFTASTTTFTATAHGLLTGDPIQFTSTGALYTGLALSTTYYARYLTANTFSVHATAAQANAGTSAISVSGGSGTHTFFFFPKVYQHTITPTANHSPNFHSLMYHDGTTDCRITGAVLSAVGFGASFQNKRMNADLAFTAIQRQNNSGSVKTFVDGDVNTTTEKITITAHGFTTGEPVTLSNTGGALPAGLAANTYYYVVVYDANTIGLAASYANAIATTPVLVNITAASGSGTHTISVPVYPATAIALNPFHFTNLGASLAITVDGVTNTTYDTTKWAGFAYQLQNSVSAEQRAGKNSYQIIEIIDRDQTLSLVFDYTDGFFKDLINKYQQQTYPSQVQIDLALQGRPIAGQWYDKIQATFYNCVLGSQDYSKTPEIGKQSLDFSVNYDLTQLKSCQFVVTNTVASYLV